MNDDVLQRHGQALEEAFFVEKNRQLLAQLRERVAREDLRATLRDAAGSVDDATLDYLVQHGIRPETLAALRLVPLVAVCWANGVVEPQERERVLEAAAKQGVQPGAPSYDLLQSWLETRPAPELFESWKQYVRALASQADPARVEALKKDILATSRDVAEAAGTLFGDFLGTSAEEKATIDEIERAFSR